MGKTTASDVTTPFAHGNLSLPGQASSARDYLEHVQIPALQVDIQSLLTQRAPLPLKRGTGQHVVQPPAASCEVVPPHLHQSLRAGGGPIHDNEAAVLRCTPAPGEEMLTTLIV